MNFLDRILGRKAAATFGSPEFYQLLSGQLRSTKSGATVSAGTALEVVTVLACVRVLAEGIAQVPLKLLQDQEGQRRRPAREHKLYTLLHRKPNAWMSSFALRETMAMHAVLTGKAFAFLNRTGRDEHITEIIPLDPGAVTVRQADDMSLTYLVRGKTGVREFPARSIWHLNGPSWDGVMGLEVVKLAREAIGLAMATEEAHARQHANGGQISGTYSVDAKLSPDQYLQLRKHIAESMTGANKGMPLIVDNGAKWLAQSMTGVDAQHIETRRFQIEQICSAFRVLPIMVGSSDKAATYASSENMFLAHLVHTLSPWYERIEQSIDTQLLTDQELADGYYAKFIEEGLLRADMKSTSEHLTKLVLNGVMTRNEARDKLDLNPLDGLDEPLTPTNMSAGQKPAGEDNAA